MTTDGVLNSARGEMYAVYGVGGFGREVMALARTRLAAAHVDPDNLVFVDDSPPDEAYVNGHRVLTFDSFLQKDASRRLAAVAIADGGARQRVTERMLAAGVLPWGIRGDHVTALDDCQVGDGAIVCNFSTLSSNIRVGRGFHANFNCYVAHDCVIGDFVTFGPAVQCLGNVVVEDLAYVGAGAILRQGRPGVPLVIGRGAVVGMGAVVTRDVSPGTTVVGNPARPLVKGA